MNLFKSLVFLVCLCKLIFFSSLLQSHASSLNFFTKKMENFRSRWGINGSFLFKMKGLFHPINASAQKEREDNLVEV